MPAAQLRQTVQHLRRLMSDDARSLSDQQLLGRYAAAKDDAAFAILVERHAAMVLGVCRRVLSHNQDAEDACQAAFLVLARKAGSIRKRSSLRCWLHGVAFRVASNLRKQRPHRPAASLSEAAAPADDITWREVQRILDEELQRLPEHFRLPLILCYLEGKTRDEAAEELGWSASTFRGRLERGRERLRKRLESKGVGLTAGLLAAMVSHAGECTAVPATLIDALLQTTAGATTEVVQSLAEGAMRAMIPSSLKLGLVVVVTAGMLGAGLSLLRDGSPVGMLPAASAREADKDPSAKKDTPAKPVGDKELAHTARKCRDAAIEWLKKNQQKDGTWEDPAFSIGAKGGPTALALLALVDAGTKAHDPTLARALKYLRELKPASTYVVALQTVALRRLNEKADAVQIAGNVEWLVDAALMGPNPNELKGWSYTKNPGGRSDFSNTQFALFALHEAGRAGFKPKNKKFWESVRALYLSVQHVDGGWDYSTVGKASFSMTCAGLCGMYLADDNIGAENNDSRKAREKASIWLARNYAPFDGQSALYNLNLMARLGKLSGEKKIGDHDWYAEGVEWLLKHQNADGGISGKNSIDNMKVIATSFGVLFLNSLEEKKTSKNDEEIERRLAATADRIVIAKAFAVPDDPPPGFETVSFEVSRTLKGSPEKGLAISMPLDGDRLPLGDGKEWIVFLRLAEEGQATPLLLPFARTHWFIRADADSIKRIAASISLPEEWGREIGGLRLGMRLREARVQVGQEVAAEITIQNTNKWEITILRHRYNIYDYWPNTRFEVAGPGRRLWMLEKPAGPISEADHPKTQVLKSGEHLIQAVRLNHWPAKQHDSDATRPNLFTEPGTYLIRGMYDHTQVKGPGFGLISKAVKLEVVEKPKANR